MKFGFKKGSYRRNVAVLASGTAFAQAIPIALSPILTRLYTPDDFGILALYASVAAILMTISTAQYELAISLPAKDEDAASLVSLAIKISALFSLTILLVVVIFKQPIAQMLGHPEIANWLFLLPISIFAGATFNVHKYWCNRRSHYSSIAAHTLQLSGITAIINIILGLAKVPGGQIIGTITGRVISAMFLSRNTRIRDKGILSSTSFSNQKIVARQYNAHPFYFLPSQLISILAQQIPIFMISGLFLISSVGFFSLALRLVALPTALIANAIGDVYRQRIAEAYNTNSNFRALYLKTLKTTSLIAIFPFAIIYFSTPSIFSFVFGEEWRIAGDYAQILVVSTFFSFVTTPLNKGSYVVSAKRYALAWNSARLASYIALWIVSHTFDFAIEQVLWCLVTVNICLYISDAYFQYRFSKGLDKD